MLSGFGFPVTNFLPITDSELLKDCKTGKNTYFHRKRPGLVQEWAMVDIQSNFPKSSNGSIQCNQVIFGDKKLRGKS